mmetsp:Transcript_58771/g.120217  ORF Transcript_58771/g.120217 Transcript_58771/m.120217 type:complete len:173 (-) Transcript_58771:289-807(-)
MVEQASRKKMFFDANGAPRIVANSRGKKRRPGSKDLGAAVRCNDAAFVSFLDGCLQWDKKERLTPDQALQHEWITEASVPSSSHAYRASPSYSDQGQRATHQSGGMGGAGGGSASARAPPTAPGLKKVADKRQAAGGYMTFRDRHLFPPIDPLAPKSARGAGGKPASMRPSQ